MAVWDFSFCAYKCFKWIFKCAFLSLRNHKNRLQFQRSDKICSTRNAYINNLLPSDRTCRKNLGPCACDMCFKREDCLSGRNQPSCKNGDTDNTRLCNGDIFFIEEVCALWQSFIIFTEVGKHFCHVMYRGTVTLFQLPAAQVALWNAIPGGCGD